MIKNIMALMFIVVAWVLSLSNVQAAEIELKVTDAYLELYTGPGSEYRIEHVLLQGETIILKTQYADWFYFEADGAKSGWAPLSALLDNQVINYHMTFDEFLIHFEGEQKFDVSFRTGLIEDDFLFAVEFGHNLSATTRVAASLRQVPGKISEVFIWSFDLDYRFMPDSTTVPFVTLGYGNVSNTPSAQSLGGEIVAYDAWKLGFGVVFAKSKRMSFVAGYYQYSDVAGDENELSEISLGLNYLY